MANKKEDTKTLYIGLDVSTTTIGIGFITISKNKIEKVEQKFYSPRKNKDYEKTTDGTIQMLVDAKINVLNIIEDYRAINNNIIPNIAVEDIILYMPKSTAQTTTILSAINRLICVSCIEKYGNLKTFPVAGIRSMLRKLINQKEKLEKQNVPAAIESYIATNHIKDYVYPMLTSKRGKTIDENYDMADAIAVALVAAINNSQIPMTKVVGLKVGSAKPEFQD